MVGTVQAGMRFQQADWWETRNYGEVVHYCNGFDQFVRGIVVDRSGKKVMLPVALVGNWFARDLPSRALDGSVYYPYHAKKVRFPDWNAPFQPHETNMWESTSFASRRGIDPTVLDAIDLSDPPSFEGAAATTARYETARLRVCAIMSNGG